MSFMHELLPKYDFSEMLIDLPQRCHPYDALNCNHPTPEL
jgi:hypothetical protein